MRKMLITIIFFAVIFSVIPTYANAQQAKNNVAVRVPINFDVNLSGGLGYDPVGFAIGSGIEVENKNVRGDILLGFSPSNKKSYGNTRDIIVEGQVLVKALKYGLFGGGFKYGHLRFTELGVSKSGVRPFLAAGIGNEKVWFLFKQVMSGSDNANHLNAQKYSIVGDYKRKFRLEAIVIHSSLDYCSYNPSCGRTSNNSGQVRLTYFFSVKNSH